MRINRKASFQVFLRQPILPESNKRLPNPKQNLNIIGLYLQRLLTMPNRQPILIKFQVAECQIFMRRKFQLFDYGLHVLFGLNFLHS